MGHRLCLGIGASGRVRRMTPLPTRPLPRMPRALPSTVTTSPLTGFSTATQMCSPCGLLPLVTTRMSPGSMADSSTPRVLRRWLLMRKVDAMHLNRKAWATPADPAQDAAKAPHHANCSSLVYGGSHDQAKPSTPRMYSSMRLGLAIGDDPGSATPLRHSASAVSAMRCRAAA